MSAGAGNVPAGCDGSSFPLANEYTDRDIAELQAIQTADLVAETVEEAARALAEYASDLRKAADPRSFGPFETARKLARDMECLVHDLNQFKPRDSVGVFVGDCREGK